MKTFWVLAVLKILFYICLVLLITLGIAYVKGSFVLSGFVIAAVVLCAVMITRSIIATFLELWVMKRMAKKFGVDLELFAQVRYEKKLALNEINWNQDYFRGELEKKRMSVSK